MRRFQRSCTTGLLGAISWFQMPRSSGTGRSHTNPLLGNQAQKLGVGNLGVHAYLLTCPGSFSLPSHYHQATLPFGSFHSPWLSVGPYQALDGQPPAHSDCPRLLSSERPLRLPAALWCPNSPDSSEGDYLISSTHTWGKATYSSHHTVAKWGSQDLNVHLSHFKVQFFSYITQGGDRCSKPSTSVASTSNLGLKLFLGGGNCIRTERVQTSFWSCVPSDGRSAVTHMAASVPQA